MSIGNSVAGVKNLRAMFETKHSDQSTSPPSRGRSSPNGSVTPNSSRPVSKVRSSFVAVERPGEAGQGSQWGLRKQSDVSSMAEIREEALKNENASRSSTVQANELGLGAILKGSPFEPVAAQLDGPADVMNQKTPEATPRGSEQAVQKPEAEQSTSQTAGSAVLKEDRHTNGELKVRTSRKVPTGLDTQASAVYSKMSPEKLKKSPSLIRKSLQSPTATKTNGLATKQKAPLKKPASVTPSSNKITTNRRESESKVMHAPTSSPKDERKGTAMNIKPPSVASKPTAASRAHAQKAEQEVATKLPMSNRPVKLPSAATASTTSSAARKGLKAVADEERKSTDRRSINVQTPRVANISTKASLAKKTSRASMTNNTEDHIKSRTSAVHKPADEGFLARMTRPTASSSQKAHEKVQINSPPRARKPEGVRQSIGRKSLNLSASEHQQEDIAPLTTAEITDDSVPKNDHAGQTVDDGESGPAEETVDNEMSTHQSQQAEIEVM